MTCSILLLINDKNYKYSVLFPMIEFSTTGVHPDLNGQILPDMFKNISIHEFVMSDRCVFDDSA